MTTVTLVQQKVYSFRNPVLIRNFIETFIVYNRGGIISASLIGIISILVLTYLFSLYLIVSFGFTIQHNSQAYDKLHQTVLERELTFQGKINFLAEEQKNILKSMERVSAIKYLTPKNVVISNPQIHF